MEEVIPKASRLGDLFWGWYRASEMGEEAEAGVREMGRAGCVAWAGDRKSVV